MQSDGSSTDGTFVRALSYAVDEGLIEKVEGRHGYYALPVAEVAI